MVTKRYIALGVALASIVALSACSQGTGGGGGSSADGAPIEVGSVNALSGPAAFPEASEAAKAVFDEFNAQGGLDGRPIQYTILDDKSDPASAASSARDLVESRNVVALVGSASLVDCAVNGAYYVEQDVLSLPGVGIDEVCFSNANISPVNVGPYGDMTLSLMFGSETLGLEKICGLIGIVGSTGPAYNAAIEKWTELTGKELFYRDDTMPTGASDFTPYIVKAKEAGCEAIVSNAAEADTIGLLRAASAQGWDDVTFLGLTSVYSDQFAAASTEVGAGMYIPAEFAPFTDASNPANADWQALMTKNGIGLTSFAQGGYLAATYFIDVLQSIEGNITRESVTAALRGMTEGIENPMVGTPWIFGPGESHNSNQAGWPVQLLPGVGAWEQAADDWVRLD